MQRAVTAIYRTYAVADLVREEIAGLGVSRGHIHVVPDRDETLETGSTRETDSYNDDLHALHLPEDELRTYQQAVRRGDYVVSVNVDDDAHLDGIMEIMRRPEDAYDIDALDEEYRDAEYVPAAGAGLGAGAVGTDHDTQSDTAATGAMGTGAGRVETGDQEVIPVAEERLRVGKRDVGRGSVHVRAYTREVPVEERVTLRDETVHVERRAPASGTLTGADAEAAFRDREVVVEEHDEEAVVTKEAVVTEEVVVSKDVETREEVISDTVRKTEVDVDDDASRR
jgi:uncharacterized protein (TIGR02271 family)